MNTDWHKALQEEREKADRAVKALRSIDPASLAAILAVLDEFLEWDEEGVKQVIERALRD